MAAAGVARLLLRQPSQRDIQFLHILILTIASLPFIPLQSCRPNADQNAEHNGLDRQLAAGDARLTHSCSALRGKLQVRPLSAPTYMKKN